MIFKILFYTSVTLYGSGLCCSIDQILQEFKRPITCLEITDSPHHFYTYSSAHRYNGVFIFLSLAEKIDGIKRKVQDHTNMVLLNPQEFSTQSLAQLAACEHIDVTVVHDIKILQRNPYIISILLMLGDHLIIDVPKGFQDTILSDEQKTYLITTEPLVHGKERLYFNHPKTSLGKARWYMTTAAQLKQPTYTILSTYTEKKLLKGHHKRESDWIPGINLVTAIMLNVVYPTNDILRKNIKKFREIDHNDPVIGNMIVQGYHLKLIDFADARRNADQEKCLNAALKLFTWIHRPKKPEKAMQRYAEYIHK